MDLGQRFMLQAYRHTKVSLWKVSSFCSSSSTSRVWWRLWCIQCHGVASSGHSHCCREAAAPEGSTLSHGILLAAWQTGVLNSVFGMCFGCWYQSRYGFGVLLTCKVSETIIFSCLEILGLLGMLPLFFGSSWSSPAELAFQRMGPWGATLRDSWSTGHPSLGADFALGIMALRKVSD